MESKAMIQTNAVGAPNFDISAAKLCPRCLSVPVLFTGTPEAAFKLACPGHQDMTTWAGGDTLDAALATWNDDHDWLMLGAPKDNLILR